MRKRLGRMKPCLGCNKEFYCPRCKDAGGTLPETKYCCNACALAARKPTPERAREMFWSRVDKAAGPDACWPWTGAKHFRGYGACAPGYGDCRAHRVSWLYTHGSLPKGLGVLHKCDNPICVNPAHLYLGDQKANAADKVARGRFGNRYQPVETLLHPHLSLRGTMTKTTESVQR